MLTITLLFFLKISPKRTIKGRGRRYGSRQSTPAAKMIGRGRGDATPSVFRLMVGLCLTALLWLWAASTSAQGPIVRDDEHQFPDNVRLNVGTGQFIDNGQHLGSSSSWGVALGDLDKDGDLDAWTANSGVDQVWLNDGLGQFSDSGQDLGSSSGRSVALGDLDKDGDLDAWTANDGPNRVWLNNGMGQFKDSGQALGDSLSRGVTLGDLDGDDDLDAWVANGGLSPEKQINRVWLNDGQGQFSVSGQDLGGLASWEAALGDVDGDGDLDAWVANGADQFLFPNQVWLNNGRGRFSDSGQVLGGSVSLDAALGDLDRDGDLDAWAANYTEPNRVWLNNGRGRFSDSGQALGGSASRHVALEDLDRDGDLDAWTANDGPNRVWFNDGTGRFADGGQALGNSRSADVALGDLDGDDDLDAWVANWEGPNRIWLNVPPPVTLTKTAQPSVVAPGGTLTYTIRVENNRSLTVTHMFITDALPAGLTPGGVLTWGPLDLAPDGYWTIHFTAVVAAGFGGTLVNTAWLTADNNISVTAASAVTVVKIYLPFILKD